MSYIENIEKKTLENTNFRTVLYTTDHLQLVAMSLKAGEDIGMETHALDQFIRVEAGQGVSILDGVETEISDGTALIIPSGTMHNIQNTGTAAMKLYTLYAPPNHKEGTVHVTKADAEKDEGEHFDGAITT